MKEIKAKEGYYLTQSADVADENRIFVVAVKGAKINEADWREATADEKAKMDAELAKLSAMQTAQTNVEEVE